MSLWMRLARIPPGRWSRFARRFPQPWTSRILRFELWIATRELRRVVRHRRKSLGLPPLPFRKNW